MAYENEINAARVLARDVLAANPDFESAAVTHGGIRLTLWRDGRQHAVRVCTDCRHDMPGDCAARSVGEDGYLHFPEEPCYQAKEAA
jgi:hypothetical protein